MASVAAINRTSVAARGASLADALREAVVTMAAALGCLACALALAPARGPAVLAVVLCLSLSRGQLERSRRERIEAVVALPLVGLAATGVGFLLHAAPWLGAAVFVAGMFVSIWLRRFGAIAQSAGSLIALPFVALLVTPHGPASQASAVPAPLLPVLIALLALSWVNALQALARRTGFLPPRPAGERARAEAPRESALRPIASTRMAIQMAVALAVAFVVGYVFFAQRWAWIVLTTFIVLSGNRGRLEVAYKSVQRVLGAAAGTLLALLLAPLAGSHGVAAAALILAAVFLGVWLRPLGYAWWALFVTIALALLQGFADLPPTRILWPRLEEIAIVAIVGIAVAWCVLPVRSTDALRRRLADALAALADALDPANVERTPGAFAAAAARVEQMAPAFRATRLVTRHVRAPQPADWADALLACRDAAVALIERGEAPADVRRALGAARKALREPAALLPALQALQQSLIR